MSPTLNILLLLPTRNRAPEVKSYISFVAPFLTQPGIDLLICDSSDDEATSGAVKELTNAFELNIAYEHVVDSGIPDEKTIAALANHCCDADYIWVTGDRRVPRLGAALDLLKLFASEGIDFIHFDHRDPYSLGRKYYRNDGVSFFRECAWNVTLYGSTVISRKACSVFRDEVLASRYVGSGLAFQMLIFEYCSQARFLAVHEPCIILEDNHPSFAESEWSDRYLWQWSTSWCSSIDKLPEIYGPVKAQTILSHDELTGIFSMRKLLQMRAANALSLQNVEENTVSLRRATKRSILSFRFVSRIPRSFLRWVPGVLKMKHTLSDIRNNAPFFCWCNERMQASRDK